MNQESLDRSSTDRLLVAGGLAESSDSVVTLKGGPVACVNLEDLDLSGIEDVTAMLRRREDRLAFGMRQIGKGLEADLASLEADIGELALSRLGVDRESDRSRYAALISENDELRKTKDELEKRLRCSEERVAYEMAIAQQERLNCERLRQQMSHLEKVNHDLQLQNAQIDRTIGRNTTSSPHENVIQENMLKFEEKTSCLQRQIEKEPLSCSLSLPGTVAGTAYDISGRGALLASRLQQVADVLARKDPVLSMLVSRLGGIVLTELRAASTSLNAAYTALSRVEAKGTHNSAEIHRSKPVVTWIPPCQGVAKPSHSFDSS